MAGNLWTVVGEKEGKKGSNQPVLPNNPFAGNDLVMSSQSMITRGSLNKFGHFEFAPPPENKIGKLGQSTRQPIRLRIGGR